MAFKWTAEHDTYLKKLVGEHGYPFPTEVFNSVVEELGVGAGSLRSHIYAMGIRAQKKTVTKPVVGSTDADVETLLKKNEDLACQVTLLKDNARFLNKQLAAARQDNTFAKVVREALAEVVTPMPPVETPEVRPIDRDGVVEDLVMHLSDEHADQLVLPEMVGYKEDYNTDVVLARAEHYVDTVLHYALKCLPNYHFETLWILAYGDHVNGEIHDATKASQWGNAMKNAYAVGQIHAQMFLDLAAHFPKVKVFYVPGNHGRRTPKKDYIDPHNTWDYGVALAASSIVGENERVEICTPHSYSAIVNIRGYNFHLQHGDEARAWNGVPYYGIERNAARLMAMHSGPDKIHYYCAGHFHTFANIQKWDGEILMNGSWKATDNYLYHAFGAVNRPMQLLHGVHSDYGITWRLPVYLRTPGAEKPKRYKISFTPNVIDGLVTQEIG